MISYLIFVFAVAGVAVEVVRHLFIYLLVSGSNVTAEVYGCEFLVDLTRAKLTKIQTSEVAITSAKSES